MKHFNRTRYALFAILSVALCIFVYRGPSRLQAQGNLPLFDFNHNASVKALYSNEHGAVIESLRDQVPGALVEKVIFNSRKDSLSFGEKVQRSGILVRYPNAQGTILICHGFMCDKFDVCLLRQIFEAGKYNVMTFDFRAHGQLNENQYCTLGRDEAYDVIAAGKFLKNYQHLKGLPLIAYGFSMGAVAAIEAQSKEALFASMILDCPFSSSKKVIKHNLSNVKCSLFGYEFSIPGKSLLQKYALHPHVQSFVKFVLRGVSRIESQNIKLNVADFKPAQSVKNISVPCFFIHCKNDQTVPLDAIKTVYQGALGQKKLWITNGRRHYDSYFYNPERYVKNVRAFIDKTVDGSIVFDKNEEVIEDGPDVFAQFDA